MSLVIYNQAARKAPELGRLIQALRHSQDAAKILAEITANMSEGQMLDVLGIDPNDGTNGATLAVWAATINGVVTALDATAIQNLVENVT